MIIVPTEKQFDWRHAPVMLFFIVALNVLTFFLYQSGDTDKIIKAVTHYQQSGFFVKEWPAFEKFLKEKGETQVLSEYQAMVARDESESVMAPLLLRDDFYAYLQHHSHEYFLPDEHDAWSPERIRLHALMQSISSVAHGLRANALHPADFITHQFLHGGLMHLLGNMFFLVICGFAVEAVIGHWRFLAFYVLSGCLAGLAQAAADWHSSVPLVGASGAISGVMAMYLAVFRLKKIEFFYWFFFFVGYFRAPALMILPFYIGKEIYSYYSDTESNVAFLAHAGGFVAGATLIGITMLINRNLLNRNYIETNQAVDPHRQQLAEIYDAIEKFRFERALAAANQLLQQVGPNFELAIIRYNILKINRDKTFDQAAIDLFDYAKLTPAELGKLGKVWQDNPHIHRQVNSQNLLKIAIQWISLDPEMAESIFELLTFRQFNHAGMQVFASKLAEEFSHLRNYAKKNQYEAIAKEIAEGA